MQATIVTTIATTVPPASSSSSSGLGVVFVSGAWSLELSDDVMSGRCVAEKFALAFDWCLLGLQTLVPLRLTSVTRTATCSQHRIGTSAQRVSRHPRCWWEEGYVGPQPGRAAKECVPFLLAFQDKPVPWTKLYLGTGTALPQHSGQQGVWAMSGTLSQERERAVHAAVGH